MFDRRSEIRTDVRSTSIADVAEPVDALDSKSSSLWEWEFESPHRHHVSRSRGLCARICVNEKIRQGKGLNPYEFEGAKHRTVRAPGSDFSQIDNMVKPAHVGGVKESGLYSSDSVNWRLSDGFAPYVETVAGMEVRARVVASNDAPELVWLLEHPPLYTAGTGAKISDLIDPGGFDVFRTGRGGQYTYHGPGQRVAYVMLDLRKRGRDVAAFVRGLEQWVIDTLAEFDVTGERRCERVGVWVTRPDGREDKIAAIGIRLRKWVSFHGIAINLNPDLSHFTGIIPCGISDHGVTSLSVLKRNVTMAELDQALRSNFENIFAPTIRDQA